MTTEVEIHPARIDAENNIFGRLRRMKQISWAAMLVAGALGFGAAALSNKHSGLSDDMDAGSLICLGVPIALKRSANRVNDLEVLKYHRELSSVSNPYDGAPRPDAFGFGASQTVKVLFGHFTGTFLGMLENSPKVDTGVVLTAAGITGAMAVGIGVILDSVADDKETYRQQLDNVEASVLA